MRKSGILNISEFLVVLVETADLFTNFDVKYAGAHPVMYLNTKTASRKYSCCLTGSQRESFNTEGSYVIKFSSPAHNSTGEILYRSEFAQIKLGGVAPNRGAIK